MPETAPVIIEAPPVEITEPTPPPAAEAPDAPASEPSGSETPTGKYTAETTADMSEADWQRINNEAKHYFELFKRSDELNQEKVIDQIIDLRGRLAKKAQETQTAMEAQLAELGLGDTEASDQKKAAADQAVEARTKEVVEASVPYTDDNRRAKKRVDTTRRAMTELLVMPAADFDKLIQDWKVYNLDKLHAEALNNDKGFRIGEKRQGARAEIAKLNSEYGGVLDAVSNLPLDKTEAGPTADTIKGYVERRGKIEAGDTQFADGLQEVNVKKALGEIHTHLKEQYKKEGLDDAQIESRIRDNTEALTTWLQNAGPENQPLADLEAYGRQKNFEQMLSAKRQKAAEYIGSGILGRFINGRPRSEAGTTQPIVDVGEVLARGVDHDGSGIKAGAEALTNPDRQDSYKSRMTVQVEMARSLGRNEGLMKIPIYLIALEKGLGESLASAWGAIPEEKKRQARKKLMLKKTVVSRALKAMQAKAAQKARQTAERAKGGPDAG